MARDNRASRPRPVGPIGILAAAFSLAIPGCAREAPLAPGDGAPLAPETAGPILADHDEDQENEEQENWKKVAEEWFFPGEPTEIKASRYELHLPADALAEKTRITIEELDPDLVDVEFGPDGTKFLAPVKLVIDYTGTSSDPDSPDYHGKPQGFFYHDPEKDVWEELKSWVDQNRKIITVQLEHFSRYGMYDPKKDAEWQWRSQGSIEGSSSRGRVQGTGD